MNVPVSQRSIGTSCREAAIAITYNYAYPQKPISEGEVLDYATSQDYFTVETSLYTSPANMVKVAGHYAGNITSGIVGDPEKGLGLLV